MLSFVATEQHGLTSERECTGLRFGGGMFVACLFESSLGIASSSPEVADLDGDLADKSLTRTSLDVLASASSALNDKSRRPLLVMNRA